jgi:enamine deaminase RidA (YjgF/YER057c/UK114 family)
MAKRQVLEVPGISHAAPIPMGVKMGNLLFSSAIMGEDPETHSLPPEPERQAELVFSNIRTLLEKAGGTTDNIARMTIFLKDMAYRDLVNEQWIKMYPNEDDRPARHALQVDLPRGMLIQVEIIAVLD